MNESRNNKQSLKMCAGISGPVFPFFVYLEAPDYVEFLGKITLLSYRITDIIVFDVRHSYFSVSEHRKIEGK